MDINTNMINNGTIRPHYRWADHFYAEHLFDTIEEQEHIVYAGFYLLFCWSKLKNCDSFAQQRVCPLNSPKVIPLFLYSFSPLGYVGQCQNIGHPSHIGIIYKVSVQRVKSILLLHFIIVLPLPPLLQCSVSLK